MRRLYQFVASRSFFYVTITVLALQALWIALTARYPQAFDEQFHFGLIQLHAHSWLPFFNTQPVGADGYGAVVRDPSYLYHYLMSLPYRLLTHITGNQVLQIIVLRCINIGFVCAALPLYHRILRRLGLSQAITNTVLFIFAITPVVPLLAAQISYDNLAILLTGLLVLACLRLQQTIKAKQPVTIAAVGLIMIVSLLGSLVKYPFLPLAAVAIVYGLIQIIRQRPSWQRPAWNAKTVGIVLLSVVSIVLFAERYGINLVRYHTPTPECDQVLSIQRCSSYSPWLRNYHLAQDNDQPTIGELAKYPASWLGHMVEESLFSIGSGFNQGINVAAKNYGTVDYWGGRSLPIPRFMTFGLLAISTIACLYYRRVLASNAVARLCLAFVLVYVGSLFILNLLDFMHIGIITAVHGRYLVPVLPLLLGIVALAFTELSKASVVRRRFSLPRQQVLATCLVVLFIVQGGGLVTYWVRSEPRWFWPQTSASRTINAKTQAIWRPLVIGSKSD